MQERTIDNALLALAKQGGRQGKLADVLLDMRGVEWSGIVQNAPLVRGRAKIFILMQLRDGPKSNPQLATAMQLQEPSITRRSAQNRCYQALLRLEDRGRVARDFWPTGYLWRVNLND